jgi:uncharacterized membrane protein YbhN (UPF0104 family)
MSLFAQARDTLDAAAAQLAHLDGRFLLPALALQLANLGLRSVVWRNVLAAAYPDRRVPWLGVAGAYAAGVALNAFVPARGGEALKVVLARGRIAGATLTTVASSLSVVLLLDGVLGALLLAGLVMAGALPGEVPSVALLPVAGVALAALAVVAVRRLRPGRARALLARVAQGAAVLRSPGRYVRTVVPFQLAAWGCRIGVAYLVLLAFRIDAGVQTAALVVVLGGLSTVVPVPGGVGTQQVLAAYALRGAAPVAGAVTFSVGMQAGVTVVNTLVGMTALMLMLRTRRPLGALRSGLALARSPRGS